MSAEGSPSFFSEAKWTDQDNGSFYLSSLKGKTVVATMGYTTCRRACIRLTVPLLKEIEAELKARGEPAEFVIFSFDSEEDKPKDLKTFLKNNDLDREHWRYLVGDRPQTKTMAKILGLDDFYRMDEHIVHKSKITVFGPDGSVRYVFDFDHRDVKLLPQLSMNSSAAADASTQPSSEHSKKD